MPLEGGKEIDAGVSWKAVPRRTMLRFRNFAIGKSYCVCEASAAPVEWAIREYANGLQQFVGEFKQTGRAASEAMKSFV